MPTVDVPLLGTTVLSLTLVAAAYTFAVSLAAGRGRPHMLVSARWGVYATCALVLLGTCLLAYAFQTHDFRIRYVARYSDRSMGWGFLVAALWGGQDGSLLWWAFLLAGWTAVCVRWMKGRWVELQPWVIATLMSIMIFFAIVMLWAANPFVTTPSVTPVDGEGLNPLLQNYWMAIHPPALYMGFVGWSVPFAFAVAALITGRLNEEWVRATRIWNLAAWLCLSVGLLLGMLWSYEELGWGGYWAWDPVENASFMPWLVGTAFVHSVIIQERYGMLKVWNIFLICLTFFMTIFGTFLTRSGLIASVHSFARSDIGIYFSGYMLFLIVGCFVLIAWRLPKMKAVHRIESLVSREFAFLLNNWILLAMMFFVVVLTTYPLLSEWLQNEEATVGPQVYNRLFVPFGIVLLVLAGVGPLISWRKATGKNLVQAFTIPTVVAVVVLLVHIFLGSWLGFAPYVESVEIYDTFTGRVLAVMYNAAPAGSSFACSFVIATIVQEYWRGTRVRMRNRGENPFTALVRLVARAKRRYGGYIVHVAIVLMYIGFTGAAYDSEKEATLSPGASLEVGTPGLLRTVYTVRFDNVRMDSDPNKRMVYTDMTILDEDGQDIAVLHGEDAPAKFIYTTHPDMPTTEVAIRRGLIEDLYLIMSTVDPQTRRGTFRAIVRPGVVWIWLGGLLLILGTFIAVAPSIRELLGEAGGPSRRQRAGAATVAGLLLLGSIAGWPAAAQAQETEYQHEGTAVVDDPDEAQLFERLLCMCGDCNRLVLATCTCSWAENKRAELRMRMSNGEEVTALTASYVAEFGAAASAIPADEGLGRAAWLVPVLGTLLAAGGVVLLAIRWRRVGVAATAATLDAGAAAGGPDAGEADEADEYHQKLESELRDLEGE